MPKIATIFQPVTSRIIRKPIAFSIKYGFYDENGHLIMIAKDRFNPFFKLLRQRHFILTNINKQEVGEITCNWSHSLWKIRDHSRNPVAKVHFFKEGSLNRGRIEAPLGTFKVRAPAKNIPTRRYKGFRITTKCVVTDSNNQSCFTVIWVDCESNPKLSREYRIDNNAQCNIDLFLTSTVAMCLVDKYMRSYKTYDHTPDIDYN